jgi:hypothetical protein
MGTLRSDKKMMWPFKNSDNCLMMREERVWLMRERSRKLRKFSTIRSRRRTSSIEN